MSTHTTDFESLPVGPVASVNLNGPDGVPLGVIVGDMTIIEREASWGATPVFGSKALHCNRQCTIFMFSGVKGMAVAWGNRKPEDPNPYFELEVVDGRVGQLGASMRNFFNGAVMAGNGWANFGVIVRDGDYGRGFIFADCIGQIQLEAV